MTGRHCREFEALIDREAQGLSDAERLRVEQHLGSCDGCLETVTMARAVRAALRAAPYELSEHARERAIGRAFTRAAGAPARLGERRRKRFVVGGAAAVVTAAAASFLLFLSPPRSELAETRNSAQTVVGHEHARTDEAVATTAEPTPSQVAGAVEPKSPTSDEQPASEREHGWIESRDPSKRSFAHARVELAATTRVRFDAEHSALELAQGRVAVDVDARRGKPFSVITEHFRVRVLGTRFVVTPDAVQVERGRVQVFGRDGRVLASNLGAGSSFHYRERASKPVESSASVEGASVWLARAREALSRGDTERARECITSAEQSEGHVMRRVDRAEVATLRAEAALLDRDLRTAVRMYLSISRNFADLPAGENGAFAAAQLAAKAEPARERALLVRYLESYPAGRFADEAKQRLKTLEAP